MRTNNETKTTVDSNVHFNVAAIMYMHVNNLASSLILDIQWTQVWSGKENMLSSELHAAQACGDEIWQTAQCHRAKNMSILNWQTKDQLTLRLLTNNRVTDKCLLTNNRHTAPHDVFVVEHRLWTIRAKK